MGKNNGNGLIQSFDERRDIVVPGDREATLRFCVEHFQRLAAHAIADHGYFAVALSGGSTPKAIFEGLTSPENIAKVDWSKCLLFWSDERAVPADHPESNYRMAMESGLKRASIPEGNIFRMAADGDIEANAKTYEELLRSKVPHGRLDLVMLGMGEDGHTASLFPRTHGLHSSERLVIANYVPQKHTWRMTLTFEGIHSASAIAIYVLGRDKAETVNRVLSGVYEPDELPVQRVGVPEHKALWILDREAAGLI